MPIKIGTATYTVEDARALLTLTSDPEVTRVLTKFNKENSVFRDKTHFLDSVWKHAKGTKIVEESWFDTFSSSKRIHAQFKTVEFGTVGDVATARLRPKEAADGASLEDEYEFLRQLRVAGIRVAPVYTGVRTAEYTEMIQRKVEGNLIDSKFPLNEKQQISLSGALVGLQVPEGEETALPPSMKKMMVQAIEQGRIPPKAIERAAKDFGKILAFLKTNYIVDLQGILESNTGRFFIIDPLGVDKVQDLTSEVQKANWRNTCTFVKNVLSFLNFMLKKAESEARAKRSPSPGPVGSPPNSPRPMRRTAASPIRSAGPPRRPTPQRRPFRQLSGMRTGRKK